MAAEVVTVRAGEQPPRYWDASVFIAMPAPGKSDPESLSSWPEIVSLFRELWKVDGRLVLFVPGPRDDHRNDDSGDRELRRADVVMFWLPTDAVAPLTFLNTALLAGNVSQHVVMGSPAAGPEIDHLLSDAERGAISVASTLAGAVRAALDVIGSGARRRDGERGVPLPVWRSDSFQSWYAAQRAAGNTMLRARLVWAFHVGPGRGFLFYWALHVSMFVAAEDRVKSNEVVISRPDISVLALYKRGATIGDTIVVLIREYRSPASTADAFVHELPGGSGPEGAEAVEQAVIEAEEETGLAIDVSRIRSHGSRQLAATLSAHRAHLFAAEITDGELAQLSAARAQPHGAGGTEQTWTEITTFAEICRDRLVDWATLGMITQVLLAARA
jgi:hypothetical protein